MTAQAGSKVFDDIRDRKISRDQWLIVLISGMGVFTDAYDLFVIGVALKLMNAERHFSTQWMERSSSDASPTYSDVVVCRFILGLGIGPPVSSSGRCSPEYCSALTESPRGKYLSDGRIRKWLVGVSVSWFAMDLAYYGNTISSPLIIKSISPHVSTLNSRGTR